MLSGTPSYLAMRKSLLQKFRGGARVVDVGTIVHKLVFACVRSQRVGIVVAKMGDDLSPRLTARKRRQLRDTTWRITWSRCVPRFVKAWTLPRISRFSTVRICPVGSVRNRFRIEFLMNPGTEKSGHFSAAPKELRTIKWGQMGAIFWPHFSGPRIQDFLVSDTVRRVPNCTCRSHKKRTAWNTISDHESVYVRAVRGVAFGSQNWKS